MQDEIFHLLMMILMLENGGGTGNINQLIIMFLLMNSQTSTSQRLPTRNCGGDCCRDDGYTF